MIFCINEYTKLYLEQYQRYRENLSLFDSSDAILRINMIDKLHVDMYAEAHLCACACVRVFVSQVFVVKFLFATRQPKKNEIKL